MSQVLTLVFHFSLVKSITITTEVIKMLYTPNSGKRSISTPVRTLINNDTWIRKEEPGQDIDDINSGINWFNSPKMGC